MIVLDSSALVAYHNARDVHHEAAVEVLREIVDGRWGRALLLEYVVLEVATVLLARRGLATAVNAVRALLDAREVEYVPCSDLFSATLETFAGQQAPALSFTDAAIVVAARRAGAPVATFDGDFRAVPGIAVVPG